MTYANHSHIVVPWVKGRLLAEVDQHDIAAELGVNQGRISEINTGKRTKLRFEKWPVSMPRN